MASVLFLIWKSFGNEFMEKGMKVKLKKEPDNEFDSEAIMVQIKGIGKCGYVANSPFIGCGKVNFSNFQTFVYDHERKIYRKTYNQLMKLWMIEESGKFTSKIIGRMLKK